MIVGGLGRIFNDGLAYFKATPSLRYFDDPRLARQSPLILYD